MLGCFFFQAWRDLDLATPTGKGPFHNNKLVCGAASEALALVFETGSLEKFWNEESGLSPSYSQMQQSLRAHLLKKVNCPYKNLRTETNADKIRNVVRYFEKPDKLVYIATYDILKRFQNLCENL